MARDIIPLSSAGPPAAPPGPKPPVAISAPKNLKDSLISHSSPRRLAGEKKINRYNRKTTIWVSHEYYLNPEFQKIPARAF